MARTKKLPTLKTNTLPICPVCRKRMEIVGGNLLCTHGPGPDGEMFCPGSLRKVEPESK